MTPEVRMPQPMTRPQTRSMPPFAGAVGALAGDA
jgi:hypothetical protein